MLWALVNTFFRCAAALLLHRVFSVEDSYRRLRILIITSIACSFLYGLAALLTAVLICQPVQAAWDNRVEGKCGNQTAAYIGLEVIGLLLDIWILLAPLRPIWNLNILIARKIRAMIMLSAGGM